MDYTGEILGNIFKGVKLATQNYKIKLPPMGNNVVNVLDTTIRKSGKWIFRFDKPHVGAAFEHININHRIAGIAKDPHLKISSGQLKAAKNTARFCKFINDFLVPAAIAVDAARLGSELHSDMKTGTFTNTITKAASIAGGWTGAYGGSIGGAMVGAAIFPGIGTIIGGIVGGVSGAMGGSMAGEHVVGVVREAMPTYGE